MFFFFYGTDTFRIAEALRLCREDVQKGLGVERAATQIRVRPDEDYLSAFERLATRDLFSRHQFVTVEDIGAFPKPFRIALLEMVERFKTQEVQFFVSYHLDKKSKGQKGDDTPGTFVKHAEKSARLDALEDASLARWITQCGASRGLATSHDVVLSLMALHGSNTARIAHEIEKLALYLGAGPEDKKQANLSDLAPLGWEQVTQDAFKIVDALGRKDRKEMLHIVLRLFDANEDPIKILGLMVYAIRSMLSVKETSPHASAQRAKSSAKGLASPKLYAKGGLTEWQVRQYKSAAAKFSLDDLKRLYERLAVVDYKTKTGEGNPRVLLERFLLAV